MENARGAQRVAATTPALIRHVHDVAVSTGAACSSNSPGPSHVLTALGLTDDEAFSCVRFSLGRATTGAEIDHAIGRVVASAGKLRGHAHAAALPGHMHRSGAR